MPYQSTDALTRRIDSLRNAPGGGSIASGLAMAIRSRKANKLEKELSALEAQNQANQQRELAMILRGQQTGRVGNDYVSATPEQFSPTDPELRKLLAQQVLGRTSDPSDLERYMAMDPRDRAAALEFRRNPYLDQGNQYTNVTNGQTVPINLRPGEEPQVRGMQEGAVQAARTAAIPGQMAAETEGLIDRGAAQTQQRRSVDAASALELLDLAEPLLEVATGSGLGAARDAALGVIGQSTEAGEAAAQLKALGGLLVSKMPRMEGPQSNYDQQLYREMAGQIGDPTIPNDVRKAALQTIRQLNEKYAAQAPAADDPMSAADEILRQAGIIP